MHSERLKLRLRNNEITCYGCGTTTVCTGTPSTTGAKYAAALRATVYVRSILRTRERLRCRSWWFIRDFIRERPMTSQRDILEGDRRMYRRVTRKIANIGYERARVRAPLFLTVPRKMHSLVR